MIKEVAAEYNLELTVKKLLKYQNKGENVRCNFNGHILYSKDITMDKAYLEVIGVTKTEMDKKQKEFMEKLKKEDDEYLAKEKENIKKWFKEGLNYIYPQRENEWLEYCQANAKNVSYKGQIIEEVLRYMQLINQTEDISKLALSFVNNKDYTGYSLSLIEDGILYFSKRGPEFARKLIRYHGIKTEHLAKIEQIEEQNKNYNDEKIKKQTSKIFLLAFNLKSQLTL